VGGGIESQVTSREHSRPAPLLYIDTKSVATKLLSWYFIAPPPPSATNQLLLNPECCNGKSWKCCFSPLSFLQQLLARLEQEEEK
jgi:hypothetical protein